MYTVGIVSGQNLNTYIGELVYPGPYLSASIYSIKGFKPLSHVGKYRNTFYSYSEVEQINKLFEYPDRTTIKLGVLIYTKISLTNRRFLNYFHGVHNWGHTKSYLYCGRTNKSIICGEYTLSLAEDTAERNRDIRELLDQASRSLVNAGY